jgi:hypothetical protein
MELLSYGIQYLMISLVLASPWATAMYPPPTNNNGMDINRHFYISIFYPGHKTGTIICMKIFSTDAYMHTK